MPQPHRVHRSSKPRSAAAHPSLLLWGFLYLLLITSIVYVNLALQFIPIPPPIARPRISVPAPEGFQWTPEKIVDSQSSGNSSSMVLSKEGNPMMALITQLNPYYAPEEISAIEYRLKFATYVGNQSGNCFSGSNWNCEIIDQTSMGSQYNSTYIYSNTIALLLNQNGNPIVIYYDPITTFLKFAEYKGDLTGDGVSDGNCYVGSNWDCEVVDNHPKVGLSNDLILNASQTPIIAYSDNNTTDMKYAEYVGNNAGNCYLGSNWNCEFVEKTSASVGDDIALALNSNNQPMISYKENWSGGKTTNDLKFAEYVGNKTGNCFPGSNWNCTKIDIFYHAGTSLIMNSNGNPIIAYGYTSDQQVAQFRLAERVGDIDGDGTPDGNCHTTTPDTIAPTNWRCAIIFSQTETSAIYFSQDFQYDTENVLHLSFIYEVDTYNSPHELQFATLVGNGNGDCSPGSDWNCELVDANARSGDTTLLFTRDGAPIISYAKTTILVPPEENEDFTADNPYYTTFGFASLQPIPPPQPAVIPVMRRKTDIYTPPLPPTHVVWDLNAMDQVVLGWTDPPSSDLKHIEVLRDCNPIPHVISGTPYDTVLIGMQQYTDTHPSPCSTLRYQLRAVNMVEQYADSPIITVVKWLNQLKHLMQVKFGE